MSEADHDELDRTILEVVRGHGPITTHTLSTSLAKLASWSVIGDRLQVLRRAGKIAPSSEGWWAGSHGI